MNHSGFYTYHDLEANPIFWRVRLQHPQTGDKAIRPMNKVNDAYVLKEPIFAEGKPLYNLHLLRKEPDKTVFIVEGEKCADALTKLGLLATTSGSAQSAKDANWQILAGREVRLWPDNDEAGLQYVKDVSAKLTGLDATVRQIDISLLNLPVKGDCYDWLVQFKQAHGHDAIKADVEALPLKTDLTEIPTSDYLLTGDAMALADNYHPTVSLQCAADITPEPIHWLWDGWLAKGKLHIFAGQAGTGKTTIAIALASTITTGGRFPDGSQCPKGSVLIWSGEDSPADTLVPRLMAAGANLNNVHFVGDTTANYELRAFDPATDMQSLMHKAATITDLALTHY